MDRIVVRQEDQKQDLDYCLINQFTMSCGDNHTVNGLQKKDSGIRALVLVQYANIET